ncbi:MAG: tRNA pseudouridine(13) synthase TruD, partial [Polyangiaceae bacterium]
LLKLRTSGGLFLCADVQTDAARAAAGEVSPTGPLVGDRMRWPEGTPGGLERRIAASILGEAFDLGRTRRLGEGTRRALRVWVEDLRWELIEGEPGHSAACMRVYFVLPKGAYATTVLGSVFDLGGAGAPEGESEDS